jgi:hypothetical protein
VPSYVYAILPADVATAPQAHGIGQAPVVLVRNRELAAVVSPVDEVKLRPQRKHLQAHQQVLVALMNQGNTPLPFAFGTVVPEEADLLNMLDRHRDAFLAQLTRVAGRREHNVRVRLDVPDLFAWYLAHDVNLAALRDATFARGRPDQDALIRLGRAFDSTRTAWREEVTERLQAVLEPVAAEIRIQPPKNDGDLCEVAALIADRSAFDHAIAAFAATLDDDHAIDVTGPWAPYSFVDVQAD